MWTALVGRHIYLDTNVFIELGDSFSPCGVSAMDLFARIEAGEVLATTSELTLAEVLVRPLASRETARVNTFQAMLAQGGIIAIVPVSRMILVAAAAVSAETRMPLPDSIHVATAARAGCDVFLTNDRGIVVPSQMDLRRLVARNAK